VSGAGPARDEARDEARVLRTSIGDLPLDEYRLGLGGRAWSILHTRAVLSHEDEQAFLQEKVDGGRAPYGIVLWPAAIALAHDLAERADALGGATLLELGAGTGLPGIVAASLGARVVQTDRQEVALEVCRRNGARNGVAGVAHRLADWTAWTDDARYDWIVGSDILYAEGMHDALRGILTRNLAPGGRVLLSDPFRRPSLALLEAMEADGWAIALAKWTVAGADGAPRAIGVYELARPAAARAR
jgi:predicted nicotinamide N-methyase